MNPLHVPELSARTRRLSLCLLWFLVLAAIPLVARFDAPSWDLNVYRHAAESLRAGHDPYTDAIAAQEAAHQRAAGRPLLYGPFLYIYSPMTLPVVRAFAGMPSVAAGALYWLIYAAGVAAISWFGLSLMERSERRVLAYYVPIALFFPGLLGSDSVMSGNVAYIFYGAALLGVHRGMRTSHWGWFYLSVLAASCFKAPMLTLLAIPALCERREWLRASGVGAAGLALFCLQPLLWPQLFHDFMRSLQLAFNINRDFGFSPAGLMSGWLYDHHLPYSPAAMAVYMAYATPIAVMLSQLSRRYQQGEFTSRQWLPVALTGVILLNPRLIEYDVAPLAVPSALICWRFFSGRYSTAGTLVRSGAVFLVLNLMAAGSWQIWKLIEGPLLVLFFLGGAWSLLRSAEFVAAEADVSAVLSEA